ncbi:conserved hypothetical protein [Paraglaciecola sp. T6c]|uniref:DUF2956 domain-containing protein n=1 Tax=Pseudoalteromonas atlantica (strain T6c / ATCC BAA-1087) TaxID=3042615 RepID=UPI00005C5BC2|nr:DUF2956 domain-containing protein [Paraglaciecola sp. T6c]ABG41413.1 conserved hypothetical protein [Paraglaciecola sp. T6c]
MKPKVSPQVEEQAMKLAKGRQKSGQTKEQTKLIAQGIQKGIADYKKQQRIKLREIDKQRKQKAKHVADKPNEPTIQVLPTAAFNRLPWGLLALSWIGFIAYVVWQSY